MRGVRALILTAVVVAAGLPAAGTAEAQSAATEAIRAIALPSGGHVHARLDGGHWVIVHRPGDADVSVSRVGSHVYALPAGASLRSFASYDLPVLAAQQYADVAAPRPASVAPHYPQVSATVRVFLPDDPAPQDVLATVVNTDDARRYAQDLYVAGGSQRLSLPTGHYSVLVFGGGLDPATHHYVVRMAFAVDQDVTADGDVLRVDLRQASRTAFARFDTATPTTISSQTQSYQITDDRGRSSSSWLLFGGRRYEVYAAAAGPAQYGRLISTTAVEGRAAGGAYRYLSWGHKDRVVPDEQVPVPVDQVSTVLRGIYTDGSIDGGIAGRTAIYPYFDPGFESLTRIVAPGRRTEELFSGPGVVWASDVEVFSDRGFADMNGTVAYEPGTTTTEDLWRGPLAPGVVTLPRGAHTYPYGGPRTCTVCRSDTGMVVGLSTVVGVPDAYGALLFAGPGQQPVETRLAIYQDGTQVYSGQNVQGASTPIEPAQLDVPASAQTYRIVQHTDRSVDGMQLSTHSSTAYRFTSAAGDGAPLDRSWACAAPGTGSCTVLPLLSVRVPVPTSLTGTLPAGRTNVIVQVGHIQGATPTPIAGLRLSLRSGAGPWVEQQVTSLGDGRYRVVLDNSARAGHTVSMEWHASDVDGSSITQTVTDAYTIVGS